MDWLTILIILAFILWPILEGMGRRSREGTGLPPGEPEEWDEEWGEWPEDEGSFAEEVEAAARTPGPLASPGPSRPEPPSRPGPPRRAPRRPQPAPRTEPDLASFLAPDEEEIRRSSERLRGRGAEPFPAFPTGLRRRGRGPAGYLSELETRAGARRAIVLSEVLGPPRALTDERAGPPGMR